MKKLFAFIKESFSYQPQTEKEVKQWYRKPPSLSLKLPWVEYDSTTQTFPLADGKTIAALFELSDIPSEARPQSILIQLQKGLQALFQDRVPGYFDEESPWILQFYVQDELSLNSLYEKVENYVEPSIKNTKYTQYYLKLLKEHCEFMTQKEGVFVDDKVSGHVFRGKLRKIRLVLYRKMNQKAKLSKGQTPNDDLEQVTERLAEAFKQAGVTVKRATGKDFYEWMLKWFNPKPAMFKSTDELLKNAPYPGDDQMPFGYDFSEKLFFSIPKSNQAEGVWYFDGLPHKYLSITDLNSIPDIGQLSRERRFGNYYYAILDKLPEGACFTLTVIIQSQEQAKNHIFKIEHSTKRGNSTESQMAKEDCEQAKRHLEKNNYLFPITMGVYLRAKDLKTLHQQEITLEANLISNGLRMIKGDDELTPVDAYLRFLPMCYDYAFDKKWLSRSRLAFASHIANLLPLYGRERGTNHPGLLKFNRCGEPFLFDPFNPQDKDQNSHLILLGSTGAGKSSDSIASLSHLQAIYRPRMVIVEAGNSFELMADNFAQYDLTVNRVVINTQKPPILNPFADSEKMLKQMKKFDRESLNKIDQTVQTEEEALEHEIETLKQNASDDEKETFENRDYLGEMTLAAQLMITGGEKKEQEKMSRQDRMFIIKAIIRAVQKVHKEKRSQMIASDLVITLQELSQECLNNKNTTHKAARLKEMADGLSLFCEDILSSKIFNREGELWPDADVTIFEMGTFKDEGYESHRALAFMTMMNKTMSQAESHQYDDRFTLFFGDEIHLIIQNLLTVVYLVKCYKMSRKIGLWIWLATQNVSDFPDNARKMLSMVETWVCLGMSEVEMKEVERFKTLTEEERTLFRSVRKASGKYVEGVFLCPHFKGLFRNIPPREMLALAMTEQKEKVQRKKLMQRFNCTELQAAQIVAKKMMGKTESEAAKLLGIIE